MAAQARFLGRLENGDLPVWITGPRQAMERGEMG